MILQGRITDRKLLIKSIEDIIHEKAVYLGSPGFKYAVGEYTILRDGCIECPDDVDETLVRELEEAGIIERQSDDSNGFVYQISDARTLVNVINTLSSKGDLINKAIGKPGAFSISARLQKSLKEDNPSTIDEVLECICTSGGSKAISGIEVTMQQIRFTGFPKDDNHNGEYKQLADRIVESSGKKRWIKPKPTDGENEKYTFRVWMNSIGMTGPEYAETRSILLEKLDGDIAFRLPEQKESFLGKRRKQVNPDEEFILL